MASYKIPILIEKLREADEKWEEYYKTHANINKTGGKEYTQAATNISNSTFNFIVRYCEVMKDVIFNTEKYRVVYDGRCYDIKNVDHYAESKSDLTIIGEFNGQNH